ncbi:ARM repeat-containing protein [Lanmaoa asiatica]|nr:ARM repeat-containing protein [Lanmaoa asiatica]
MGKSQKKRAMRRHNPMRVPDSHLPQGLGSAESASTKIEAILPIIQKMESPDGSERKWACVAVSNLIQNDPSTRRLLQGKNVVGALITRLSDSEEEVWIEAAGALRNLCIDGGYDICAEMYNKNILAPLRTFVPKVCVYHRSEISGLYGLSHKVSATLAQFLESPRNAPENAKKMVYEFADNVITILWCLSETSNKALNAINQINLIPFLVSFLSSRDKLPISTVVAAAQSLYVLTDDNRIAIDEVRSYAAYSSCLFDIVRCNEHDPKGKSKDLSRDRFETLKVLSQLGSTGIMSNVSPLPPPTAVSTVDVNNDLLLPILRPVISSVSLDEVARQVQALITRQVSYVVKHRIIPECSPKANEPPSIEKLSLKDTPKSDHKSQTELDLERLENKLRTIQLALEILTGACATLPDPVSGISTDEDDEEDLEDEDVEMGDDMTEGIPLDENTHPREDTNRPSMALLPELVRPLLTLVQPTSLSFSPPSSPSIHPPTTSALSAIHVSAFECLNNLFLSLSASPNAQLAADEDTGRAVWSETWAALSKVGLDIVPGQERKQEIWEIAVGVLWGIGNIWKGKLVPIDQQAQILMSVCDSSTEARVQVKCIGTLECLAQYPDSIEANQVISSYLLSILPTATTPSAKGTEPLLQAVSALIDIYSDERLSYDINFRNGRFIDRLVESVDGLRKAVRAIDRRKERDLKLRGEEVRDNLVAFIEYRRAL